MWSLLFFPSPPLFWSRHLQPSVPSVCPTLNPAQVALKQCSHSWPIKDLEVCISDKAPIIFLCNLQNLAFLEEL